MNMQINDHKYDLAVIGGGPAGSLAAALAAEAGFSTVVLEQKKLPRFKACGGFVSARALSTLPADLDQDQIPGEPVFTIRVISRGRSFEFRSARRLGMLVRRENFDHYLVRHAAGRGAVLREEHTLQALDEPGSSSPIRGYYRLLAAEDDAAPLYARYVIGADGALGRCGVLSGLRTQRLNPCGRGFSEIIETGPESDSGEAEPGTLNFYPLPWLGGMGWSFHGPGWINRGVGGLLGPGMLKKAYGRMFKNQRAGSGPSWWPLPFLGPLKQAGRGNLLLIGDAAGLVEPLSGEGLFNAFTSAILAFYALLEAEKSGMQAGNIYNRYFKAQFREAFMPALAGTLLLHGRALFYPASMPGHMASIMDRELLLKSPFK